jgi:hypothetical protein
MVYIHGGAYSSGSGSDPLYDGTRLAARGDVGLGEAWIDGDWHSNTLEALLTLALRNLDRLSFWAAPGRLAGLRMRVLDQLIRVNSLRGSAHNVRAHYDLGNEFYHLWLDAGMTYSSALFAEGDDLERAQARKNARILSRLGPGETILEIGCGWGGFAEAAADQGHRVTGLTLSPAQKGYADARLDGRAEIRLQDYRLSRGRFDNIVSIEMIEAVGERFWPTYFAQLSARLGLPPLAFTPADLARLSAYAWPGNVRELRNLVERSLILGGLPAAGEAPGFAEPLPLSLAEVEKRHILAVLDQCGGNHARAAALLGVSRKTIDRKAAEWGLA